MIVLKCLENYKREAINHLSCDEIELEDTPDNREFLSEMYKFYGENPEELVKPNRNNKLDSGLSEITKYLIDYLKQELEIPKEDQLYIWQGQCEVCNTWFEHDVPSKTPPCVDGEGKSYGAFCAVCKSDGRLAIGIIHFYKRKEF